MLKEVKRKMKSRKGKTNQVMKTRGPHRSRHTTHTRLSHTEKCVDRLHLHLPLSTSLKTMSFSSFSTSPSMAATSGSSWICAECGNECKSCGGLTKHFAVHKQNPHVGSTHEIFQHIHHPTFNGRLTLLFITAASYHVQEYPVTEMESFFHQKHRRRLHIQNTMTIGPRLPCTRGLNWPRSYTKQHRSQTTPLINSSAFGAPISDHHDLHSTINTIKLNHVPW